MFSKNFKKFVILVFATILFGQVSFAFMSDELAIIKVYEKINPAIVSIDAELPLGISSGSGCIVTKDGIIITSSHVVENSKKIDVTTNDGIVYPAKVLKESIKNTDLALIKINPKNKLPTITLGNSEEIKVGQKVLAIGNPFGFSGTLTQGIVSRIDYSKNKIQTDAAINPGNSGGPIINTTGEVIGISQSIYNPDNNYSNIGIGFAIPINSVKDYLISSKKIEASN